MGPICILFFSDLTGIVIYDISLDKITSQDLGFRLRVKKNKTKKQLWKSFDVKINGFYINRSVVLSVCFLSSSKNLIIFLNYVAFHFSS